MPGASFSHRETRSHGGIVCQISSRVRRGLAASPAGVFLVSVILGAILARGHGIHKVRRRAEALQYPVKVSF